MGVNLKEIKINDFKYISRKSVLIIDLNNKEHIIPEKAFTTVELGVCAIDEYWIDKLGINKKQNHEKKD